MMALRCLLGRTLKPKTLGFCGSGGGSGGVTAGNYSLKAGHFLFKWDFPSPDPPSVFFEDFPAFKDHFANRKPLDVPEGMNPEDFGRPFGGGIACVGPVTDSEVVNPARFAVQQHNANKKTKLEFVRVLRAYHQGDLRIKYILILEAIDAGVKKKCRAEVLCDATIGGALVLLKFEVVPGSPET